MKRSASATGHGGLKDGDGRFGVASGAIQDQRFGFRTGFEDEIEEAAAATKVGCPIHKVLRLEIVLELTVLR